MDIIPFKSVVSNMQFPYASENKFINKRRYIESFSSQFCPWYLFRHHLSMCWYSLDRQWISFCSHCYYRRPIANSYGHYLKLLRHRQCLMKLLPLSPHGSSWVKAWMTRPRSCSGCAVGCYRQLLLSLPPPSAVGEEGGGGGWDPRYHSRSPGWSTYHWQGTKEWSRNRQICTVQNFFQDEEICYLPPLFVLSMGNP